MRRFYHKMSGQKRASQSSRLGSREGIKSFFVPELVSVQKYLARKKEFFYRKRCLQPKIPFEVFFLSK